MRLLHDSEAPKMNTGLALHAGINASNFIDMPVIPAKAGISWTCEGSIRKSLDSDIFLKRDLNL